MVLTYRSFATDYKSVTTTTPTVTLALQTNSEYHLVIVDFYAVTGSATLTPPAGWTLKVNVNNLLVYEANGTPGTVWTVGGSATSGFVYFAIIGFDKPGKLLYSGLGTPNSGVISAAAPTIPVTRHGVVLNLALFAASGFSNSFSGFAINPTGLAPTFQTSAGTVVLRTGAAVGGIYTPPSSAGYAPSRTFSVVGLSKPDNIVLARGYSFLLAEEDDLKIRQKVGSTVHNLAKLSAKKSGLPVNVKRAAVKKNGVVTPLI